MMASKRCGCASDQCACVVTGGVGVEVSGTGTKTNPYVLDASPSVPNLTVQDENTTVRSGVTTIDFTGGGVTATTGTEGEVIVTVPTPPTAQPAQVAQGVASASTTMDTTVKDIPGCSVTLVSAGTTDRFLVWANADMVLQAASNSAATIGLLVDGVAQNGQIVWIMPGASILQTRVVLGQHWMVTGLAAGNRIFKLQTGTVTPAGAFAINQTHTRVTVIKV